MNVFVLRMPGRGRLDYIFHVHNPRTLSARPEGMMFVFLSFLRHQSAGIVDLTFHSFRYSCREAHSKMNDFFRSTSLNKYLTVCRKLSQTVWTDIFSPRGERETEFVREIMRKKETESKRKFVCTVLEKTIVIKKKRRMLWINVILFPGNLMFSVEICILKKGKKSCSLWTCAEVCFSTSGAHCFWEKSPWGHCKM